MSRKFNQEEKAYIMSQLIKRGADLFRQYGFKKTSINDITNAVGIAQGTFYHFFTSKESLYFTILEKEEEKMTSQFFTAPSLTNVHPKEFIKQSLKNLIGSVENNPLIRDLFIRDTMKQLLKKIPPEQLKDHFSHDESTFQTWLMSLKNLGIASKLNSNVMTGLFRALFMLSLHKQEIGENVYRDVINVQIDLIVEHLFIEED